MANANLHKAKRAKNDEFYTRREDIEAELQHYNEHFRGKVVYCNCDDPAESEFVRYFCRVFRPLGLKKLIATHYDYNEQNYTYSLELDADDDTLPEVITPDCMTKTPLESNGDFRSASCVELLKQADIVVTNPPFSLFREYVAQLVEYDKKFIIMGNKNAITYKEFFPLLKGDKVWVGATSLNGGRWMIIPDWIKVESKKAKVDADGRHIINVAGVCWFTNCDIPKRHEPIDLTGNYYDPEVNPKYDNYDAIEVSKVAEIPIDYEPGYLVSVTYREQLEDAGFILGHERNNAAGEMCVCVYVDEGTQVLSLDMTRMEWCNGIMGVPITFMNQYVPEQFQIVGTSDNGAVDDMYKLPHFKRHNEPYIGCKKIYKRLFIRRMSSSIAQG